MAAGFVTGERTTLNGAGKASVRTSHRWSLGLLRGTW